MTILHNMLAGAALALALSSSALAQATSTQPTATTGTVFLPIVVTKDSDLSFGTVARPESGSGTVTIAAVDGARSLAGGGTLLSGGPGGSASRAAFTVSGEGGQTFSISVPATFNITRSGGSESLLVTLTSTAVGGTLSGALGAAGTSTFGVGGSIPVNSTTVSGAYSGNFNVTVNYN